MIMRYWFTIKEAFRMTTHRIMANQVLISLVLLLLTSCGGENMSQVNVSLDALNKIPEAVWQKLAEKKIYFGHQSVGFNIIDGIEDIKQSNTRIKLTIVKVGSIAELKGPMFAHSSVGQNSDPSSKMKAFVDILEQGTKNQTDIAFFKFCYVDIFNNTDVDKMFAEYKNTLELLKKNHPGTRFVHVTVPLTETKKTMKNIVKKLLGRVDDNVNRNIFNDMLRKEYSGKEPIFDIAMAESTYPDGARMSFKQKGVTYYSLVPEYTTDGGHLNEQGKRAVAQELLLLLAKTI